jgi:hypothetical protein
LGSLSHARPHPYSIQSRLVSPPPSCSPSSRSFSFSSSSACLAYLAFTISCLFSPRLSRLEREIGNNREHRHVISPRAIATPTLPRLRAMACPKVREQVRKHKVSIDPKRRTGEEAGKRARLALDLFDFFAAASSSLLLRFLENGVTAGGGMASSSSSSSSLDSSPAMSISGNPSPPSSSSSSSNPPELLSESSPMLIGPGPPEGISSA